MGGAAVVGDVNRGTSRQHSRRSMVVFETKAIGGELETKEVMNRRRRRNEKNLRSEIPNASINPKASSTTRTETGNTAHPDGRLATTTIWSQAADEGIARGCFILPLSHGDASGGDERYLHCRGEGQTITVVTFSAATAAASGRPF